MCKITYYLPFIFILLFLKVKRVPRVSPHLTKWTCWDPPWDSQPRLLVEKVYLAENRLPSWRSYRAEAAANLEFAAWCRKKYQISFKTCTFLVDIWPVNKLKGLMFMAQDMANTLLWDEHHMSRCSKSLCPHMTTWPNRTKSVTLKTNSTSSESGSCHQQVIQMFDWKHSTVCKTHDVSWEKSLS